MKELSVVIVSLLLTQSLGQEVNLLPRKSNLVSDYLSKVLDSVFAQVSTKNLSIPVIDLGEGVGRFTDVKGSILGEMKKNVDGYKSFGFNLDMNVTKILLAGYYDIQNLDVPGLFPVFGNGDFSIAVESINLKVLLNAMYDFLENKFDINILQFDIIVKNSTVKFENLMNDPFVADFLNQLISNLIPDLITMITPPVLKILKPFIDQYGNDIFLCIKKESTPEKIEECIKNIFQKNATEKVEMFFSRLDNNLYSKLAPKI